jgi:hypothetical protein
MYYVLILGFLFLSMICKQKIAEQPIEEQQKIEERTSTRMLDKVLAAICPFSSS